MSIKLHLDSNRRSFSPGDEISGRVDCYFDESAFRAVKVRLKCKEHNQWVASESYYDATAKRTKTRRVTYTGNNLVISKEQILYSSDSSDSHIRGRHSFPFRFVLPLEIPSSFEGPYGFVAYKLKGIVDRPWRFDYEDECSLDIKSPLYVDRFPAEYLVPTTFEDDKTVCCLCCTGGDISMNVQMARMVFVPGESVNMKVKLTNLSNLNVDQLKIKFEKIVTFKVTSPSHRSKTSDTEIFNVREHGVGAHGEYTYNLSIPIPHYLEVPNFNKCELFEVHYRLKIEACLDGCSTNLDINTYPSLAHVASQRISNIPTSTPGFNVLPSTSRPTAPPTASSSTATAPLASVDVVDDINPPSYDSLIPEKGVYAGGPPTAPTVSISAPPLPSASNSGTASSLETPPPIYNELFTK